MFLQLSNAWCIIQDLPLLWEYLWKGDCSVPLAAVLPSCRCPVVRWTSLELAHRIRAALSFKDPPKRPRPCSAGQIHALLDDLPRSRGTGTGEGRSGYLPRVGQSQERIRDLPPPSLNWGPGITLDGDWIPTHTPCGGALVHWR